MLTGSCAHAMTRTLNDLFAPVNERLMRRRFAGLDPAAAADLSLFLAGGAGAVLNDWLVDGADPLDPEDLARRLRRLVPTVTDGLTR